MSWSDRYTTNEMNNIISNLLDIVSSMVEDWYNCDMNVHNKSEVINRYGLFEIFFRVDSKLLSQHLGSCRGNTLSCSIEHLEKS